MIWNERTSHGLMMWESTVAANLYRVVLKPSVGFSASVFVGDNFQGDVLGEKLSSLADARNVCVAHASRGGR